MDFRPEQFGKSVEFDPAELQTEAETRERIKQKWSDDQRAALIAAATAAQAEAKANTQTANFVTTSTVSFSLGRPNYCSNCGTKIGDGWNYCGGCGRAVASAPQVWPTAWPNSGIGTIGGTWPPPEKCAYDGLPPGAYHLVCNCPKHRINL